MAPATGMLSRGPGRDSRSSAKDERGKHAATARRMRRAVPRSWRCWSPGLSFTLSAMAAPITIVDDGGADDNVGQKDLNQPDRRLRGEPARRVLELGRHRLVGGNTGDACALFDTNGNGFADNAVCVGVGGDPATQQYVTLWDCSDKRADRCTAPSTSYLPTDTSFTSSVVSNSDPFRDDAAHTASDCKAASSPPGTNCVTDGHGGQRDRRPQRFHHEPTTAKPLNVCSYESASPTSNPEECVITPDSGFLTIVKVADPDDGTAFPVQRLGCLDEW